jgi:hypothetical protein
MKIHRDFNFRDNVLSIEHSPPLFHVEDLDGKNIGGLLQLIPSEEKRRGFLLFYAPPLHYVCDTSQFFNGQGVKDASHIEIGESWAEISARRRAKQDDAFEVCRREVFEPVH